MTIFRSAFSKAEPTKKILEWLFSKRPASRMRATFLAGIFHVETTRIARFFTSVLEKRKISTASADRSLLSRLSDLMNFDEAKKLEVCGILFPVDGFAT